MTPARVTEKDQISINGNLFKTRGRVRERLASNQPGKLTLGDYSDKSNPFSSEWSFSDARGGIGVEVLDPRTDLDRVWWATLQLRFLGQIVLPRLATITAAGPASEIQEIPTFLNEVYPTFGTAVHVFNNTTDSQGNSVRTLLNNATDFAVGILFPSGVATETLVIATGSEVDYATNSSTWNRNTTNIKYVVFWNNLLWGIDNAGQLYYTDDLSLNWSIDAQLTLPAGYIRGLLIGRGADGLQHVYASTKVGLFIHDDFLIEFTETDMSSLPVHDSGGLGTTKWQGPIYFPAGNGIYEFNAGTAGTTVNLVGPDQDHGLPQDKRGVIVKLLSSHNDLLAVLDASTADGVSKLTERPTRGFGNHHGVRFPAQTGFGMILGRNKLGWEVKWLSGSNARPITTAAVSNAYGENRLWWASNQRMYWMKLPSDTINPLQVPDTTYESSGTLETPWNDFQQKNQNKLLLSVILETTNPTSSETVKVEYALDNIESYTDVVTQSVTGESETTFPIGGAFPIGKVFKSIKFRITLTRGSTNTNTPELNKLTLVWRQRNKELVGISADIMLGDANDKSAIQVLDELKTAAFTDTLIQVTYRSDDSEEQNYSMEVLNYEITAETGEDYSGIFRINLIEPRQTRAR